MGRGDKRTRKGKIFRGSFGKSRPRKVIKQKA
jgi:30S ribosomal protein S31